MKQSDDLFTRTSLKRPQTLSNEGEQFPLGRWLLMGILLHTRDLLPETSMTIQSGLTTAAPHSPVRSPHQTRPTPRPVCPAATQHSRVPLQRASH